MIFLALILALSCWLGLASAVAVPEACIVSLDNPVVIIDSVSMTQSYKIDVDFTINPDCVINPVLLDPVSASLLFNGTEVDMLVQQPNPLVQKFHATTTLDSDILIDAIEAIPLISFQVTLNFLIGVDNKIVNDLCLNCNIICTDPDTLFCDYSAYAIFSEDAVVDEDKLTVSVTISSSDTEATITGASVIINHKLIEMTPVNISILNPGDDYSYTTVSTFVLTGDELLADIKTAIMFTETVTVAVVTTVGDICLAIETNISHSPILSEANICSLPEICESIQYGELLYRQGANGCNSSICIEAIIPAACYAFMTANTITTDLYSFLNDPENAIGAGIVAMQFTLNSTVSDTGYTKITYCSEVNSDEIMEAIQSTNSLSLNYQVNCAAGSEFYVSGIMRETPTTLDLLQYVYDEKICHNITETASIVTYSNNIQSISVLTTKTSLDYYINVTNSTTMGLLIPALNPHSPNDFLFAFELNGDIIYAQPVVVVANANVWLIPLDSSAIIAIATAGVVELILVKKAEPGKIDTIVCQNIYAVIDFASVLLATQVTNKSYYNTCATTPFVLENVQLNPLIPDTITFEIQSTYECLGDSIVISVNSQRIPATLITKVKNPKEFMTLKFSATILRKNNLIDIKESGLLTVLALDQNGLILNGATAATSFQSTISAEDCIVEIDPMLQSICDLDSLRVVSAIVDRARPEDACSEFVLSVEISMTNACFNTNPVLVYYIDDTKYEIHLQDYNSIAPLPAQGISTQLFMQFKLTEAVVSALQFNPRLSAFLYSNCYLVKKDINIVVNIDPLADILVIDPSVSSLCYVKQCTKIPAPDYFTPYALNANVTACGLSVCAALEIHLPNGYVPGRLGMYDNNLLLFAVNTLSLLSCYEDIVMYVEVDHEVFEATSLGSCLPVPLLATTILYTVQLSDKAAQNVRRTNSIRYYGVSNGKYIQFPYDEMCVEDQLYNCLPDLKLDKCNDYIYRLKTPMKKLTLTKNNHLIGEYDLGECKPYEFVPILHVSDRIYNMTLTTSNGQFGIASAELEQADADAIRNTKSATLAYDYITLGLLLNPNVEINHFACYPLLIANLFNLETLFLDPLPVIVETCYPEIDHTLPEVCRFKEPEFNLLSSTVNEDSKLTISFSYFCECYDCPTNENDNYPWTLYLDTTPKIYLTTDNDKQTVDTICNSDDCADGAKYPFIFSAVLPEEIVEQLRDNPNVFLNIVSCNHYTIMYHYPLQLSLPVPKASLDNLVNPSCAGFFANLKLHLGLDFEHCKTDHDHLLLNAMTLTLDNLLKVDLNLCLTDLSITPSISTIFYFYLDGIKYVIDPADGYLPIPIIPNIIPSAGNWFSGLSSLLFTVRDCHFLGPVLTTPPLDLYCTTTQLVPSTAKSVNNIECRRHVRNPNYTCPTDGSLFNLKNTSTIRMYVEQNGKLIRDDVIVDIGPTINFLQLDLLDLNLKISPNSSALTSCAGETCDDGVVSNVTLSADNVLTAKIRLPRNCYTDFAVSYSMSQIVIPLSLSPSSVVNIDSSTVLVSFTASLTHTLAMSIRNANTGIIAISKLSSDFCNLEVEVTTFDEAAVTDALLPHCYATAQDVYLQNLELTNDGTLSVRMIGANPADTCGFGTNCTPYLTTMIGEEQVQLFYVHSIVNPYRTFRVTGLTHKQVKTLKNNLFMHFDFFTCNGILQRCGLFETLDLPIDEPTLGLNVTPLSAKIVDSFLELCFVSNPLAADSSLDGSVVLTTMLGYIEYYFTLEESVTTGNCFLSTLPLNPDTLAILKLSPTFIVWVNYVESDCVYLEAKVPFYVITPEDVPSGVFSFDCTCSSGSFAVDFEQNAEACIDSSSLFMFIHIETDCAVTSNVTARAYIGDEEVIFKLSGKTGNTYEFKSTAPISDAARAMVYVNPLTGIFLYENDDLVYSGSSPYCGVILPVGECTSVGPSSCLYETPVNCANYPSERALLDLLYQRTGGSTWRYIGNWSNPNSPVCASNSINGLWGVSCTQDGHVASINLENNHLTGCLPNIFHCFKHLKAVNLGSNFDGTTQYIPDSICNTTNLQSLQLGNSNFVSPMPQCLSNLEFVMHVDVSSNQLSGNAEDELNWATQTPNLRSLDASCNNFTTDGITGFYDDLAALDRFEGVKITGNGIDSASTSKYEFYLDCDAKKCPPKKTQTNPDKVLNLEGSGCCSYYLDQKF